MTNALAKLKEHYVQKRKFYEKKPEEHPKFSTERAAYLRAHSPSSDTTDEAVWSRSDPQWNVYWRNRLREMFRLEYDQKKADILRRYGHTKEAQHTRDVNANELGKEQVPAKPSRPSSDELGKSKDSGFMSDSSTSSSNCNLRTRFFISYADETVTVLFYNIFLLLLPSKVEKRNPLLSTLLYQFGCIF